MALLPHLPVPLIKTIHTHKIQNAEIGLVPGSSAQSLSTHLYTCHTPQHLPMLSPWHPSQSDTAVVLPTKCFKTSSQLPHPLTSSQSPQRCMSQPLCQTMVIPLICQYSMPEKMHLILAFHFVLIGTNRW